VDHLECVITHLGSDGNAQIRLSVGQPDDSEAVLINFVDGVSH
jgi:hypothetical protein